MKDGRSPTCFNANIVVRLTDIARNGDKNGFVGFGVGTIMTSNRFVILLRSNIIAYGYITNNAWVTVNNDFLLRVRRFGNYFHEWRSHEWNHCRIASRVKKMSLFTVTNVLLLYFLHAILCPESTIPLKTIIDRWFRHFRQGRSFLTQHCDITTGDLWRHTNVGY